MAKNNKADEVLAKIRQLLEENRADLLIFVGSTNFAIKLKGSVSEVVCSPAATTHTLAINEPCSEGGSSA